MVYRNVNRARVEVRVSGDCNIIGEARDRGEKERDRERQASIES